MSRAISITKYLLMAFILTSMCVLLQPKAAEAIDVKVTNTHSQTLNVAFCMYSTKYNNWIVRGWYSVTPNSTRTMNFPSATKDNLYVHAYTSEASWGSEKRWTVINKAFTYVAGQSCPNGPGRRQVGFDRYYAENNGVVNIRF